MRFGIAATSCIFPKNFLTRLRPVNVCAIVPLCCRPAVFKFMSSRDDSPESRNPSRLSGQAYGAPFLDDSGFPNRRIALPLRGKDGDSRALAPKSPIFVQDPAYRDAGGES